MGFHPIAQTVNRRLGHLVSEESRMVPGGVAMTRRHLTYPIVVHRPAQGSTKIQQFCPVCKSGVELSVASARTTRLRQRVWLIVGLVALALAALSVAALVRKHFPNASPLYPGLVVTGLAGLLGLAAWWNDDGISVARGGRSARRLHRVFAAPAQPQPQAHVPPGAPQQRFRPAEMRKPPVPVTGAAVSIGLVFVALCVDAIARIAFGVGPVPAIYAILGALISGLTALGLRRGNPVFRGFAVFWGLVFLVAALGHRTVTVWGSAGLVAAALWGVASVLAFAPRSSRLWFRPSHSSARRRRVA